MSLKERVVLGIIVGSFSLLQGLCGGYLARHLKLNALHWFVISAIPIVGIHALVMLQSQVTALQKATTDTEKKFQQLAFSFRMGRFQLIASLLLWLFIPFLLVDHLPLPGIVIGIVWLAGAAFIVSKLNTRLPDCPDCRKKLGDLFGRHCPECAGALSPGATKTEANCISCGKTLRNAGGKKGRNFRIYACSHCGALLDKVGLE